ncbi:MAG: hypothetical protein IAE90_09230 [Ignavibacteria bacterium]|nr:hypothetical protein [Ignavibacteria bacterium]
MRSSKLAGILSAFSKTEFIEFGKFIRSPYHNRSERDLESFYKAIKPYYPGFNISKEALYSRLYPGKQYNEKTIKNMFTDTFKMAKDFLAHNNFRESSRTYNNFLSEALLSKNLESEYNKSAEISLDLLNEMRPGSEDYFLNLRRYHQHRMIYSKSVYKNKNESLHIQSSIEALLILLLKDLSNVLVNKELSVYLHVQDQQSKLLELFFQNFDIDKFMQGFKELNDGFYPFVAFRYYLYKDLGAGDDITWFYRLKETVVENFDKFSAETQFEATWAVINSCAMTSRRAMPEMRRESFEMLKLQLTKGLHIAPGSSYYLTPAFNQMLTEALYFREFEYIKNVIRDHSAELEPGIREDMQNWGYASIYYEKGEYEKALGHASKINFKESNFKVQSKFLLFKLFYEMELTEQALSILNTSLHALKLEDLSAEVKARYEKSFRFAIALIRLRDEPSLEEKEMLKRRIEKENFIGKKWMQNELESM